MALHVILKGNGEGMIDAAHLARKTFFAMGRTLNLKALTPRSFAGVGGILMLHRVSPTDQSPLGVNRGLSVTPQFLDELIGALKHEGYDFVPMDEVPARVAKTNGKPFLAVTFDDGYKDNDDHAYPVLRRHNVPWTVYIAPGLMSGDTHLWWELAELALARRKEIAVACAQGALSLKCDTVGEKLAAFGRIERHVMHDLPEESVAGFTRDVAKLAGINARAHNKAELMGWDAIRKIAQDPLCTIGTHTWHHYHLARLTDEVMEREFTLAMTAIELETGLKPRHVAYPYGYQLAVGKRETDTAERLGYATGVTTRHGMLFHDHAQSMTALPRISVNGKHQNVGDVRLMLSGITSWLAHRHGGAVTL
jgi:peptidoglycan/xylan/chitin deacetylase (PgdA/CDA1 family)